MRLLCVFAAGEQWGDCLVRQGDTRPSCVPRNRKMAITNNDPVKANGPGQPVVNQIALLKLGDSPYPEGGVQCIHTPGSWCHLIGELLFQAAFSAVIRLGTLSLIKREWNMNGKWKKKCRSSAVCYIFSDVKSTLNTPLSASSFPPCHDPATLLIANVARAVVYDNCSGHSITSSGSAPFSGIVTCSTIELERGHQQQLEPTGPHTGTTVS